MTQPWTETAYAKVNLALHVRARRDDGYHELETLFAFVDDGDALQYQPSDQLSLTVSGPFADAISTDASNLVLRAASVLHGHCQPGRGAALHLDKRLPVAAGIGGGSADAAAALRLLARVWQCDVDEVQLAAISASIGADVPACVYSRCSTGTGTGTDLVLIADDAVAGVPILLVNPLVPCPTGPVFAAWDGVDHGPLPASDARSIAQQGRNDLEPAARSLCPDIDDVMTLLRAQLPRVARMSGSGATCFALFDDDALLAAAADRIADDHPEWWVMAGHLR